MFVLFSFFPEVVPRALEDLFSQAPVYFLSLFAESRSPCLQYLNSPYVCDGARDSADGRAWWAVQRRLRLPDNLCCMRSCDVYENLQRLAGPRSPVSPLSSA